MDTKPVILYYGQEFDAPLSALCERQGIRLKHVSREECGLPIFEILDREDGEGKPFPEEMLVMARLPQERVFELIDEMRKEQIKMLKAVLTTTNRLWSSDRLYSELCEERERFRK